MQLSNIQPLSPPSLVNAQKREDDGEPMESWDSAIISFSADSFLVSGGNMGLGGLPGKTLQYERSHPIHRHKQEGFEEIIYFVPLSSSAKWLCCQCCCWEMLLRPRSYFKVTENAIEYNVPILVTSICPFERWVLDCPLKTFLDKTGIPFHASVCSPFHFLGCIECCGDVVAVAPCKPCANILCQCCFPCFFKFYPGLETGTAPAAVEAIRLAQASCSSRRSAKVEDVTKAVNAANPAEETVEMEQVAVNESSGDPSWRLGTSRLAPPVPAKYEAETDVVNHGTKLGAKIAMKTNELKKMEKELADLKARLNEAQQKFDSCLDVYMEKKNECDELKKKKAYVRVFGQSQQ